MIESGEPVTDGASGRADIDASVAGDGGTLQLVAVAFLIVMIAFLIFLTGKPMSWGPEPRAPRTVFPYNGAQPILPAAPQPLRDAVASSSLGSTFGIVAPAAPVPTRLAARSPEYASTFPATPAPRPPVPAGTWTQPAKVAAPPTLSPAFSSQSRWEWANLWSRPGEFLLRQTWLKSPARLNRGLSRPEDVDGFLQRPLVRSVLASPTMMGLLLGNQALVGAFLKSPAMQDPAAVQALMSSRITQEILASPGVQGIMKDPGAMIQVLGNPELVDWMRANPAVAERLGSSSARPARR